MALRLLTSRYLFLNRMALGVTCRHIIRYHQTTKIMKHLSSNYIDNQDSITWEKFIVLFSGVDNYILFRGIPFSSRFPIGFHSMGGHPNWKGKRLLCLLSLKGWYNIFLPNCAKNNKNFLNQKPPIM